MPIWRFELTLYKPTGALRIDGRRNPNQKFLVFLELARTLPRIVRVIPKEGGRKYDWEKKITCHLDLNDISELCFHLTEANPGTPNEIYRPTVNHKPKTISIAKAENGAKIVRGYCEGQEVVLTLSPSDVFLLTNGLISQVYEMIWKQSRN